MIFVGGCVKDVRDFYLFQVWKNGEVHRLHALMSLDAFVLTDGRRDRMVVLCKRNARKRH